ncbi:hypothetical protein [Methylopila sp. 73B]|uniref:hypothetical protein n=1 Tax=Methylopila sp. 73B TaxID=1120792 RepID=UPI000381C746|nr:hypothetical protein [Methylopila sp. 73B]
MPIHGGGIHEPQATVRAKPNRLFYLGTLAAVVSIAFMFLINWRGLVLLGLVLAIVATLGLTGKLDLLEPLWIAIGRLLS